LLFDLSGRFSSTNVRLTLEVFQPFNVEVFNPFSVHLFSFSSAFHCCSLFLNGICCFLFEVAIQSDHFISEGLLLLGQKVTKISLSPTAVLDHPFFLWFSLSDEEIAEISSTSSRAFSSSSSQLRVLTKAKITLKDSGDITCCSLIDVKRLNEEDDVAAPDPPENPSLTTFEPGS